MGRIDKVQNAKDGQYINACYIKSAFREIDPAPVPNVEAPYGLIIATQGPIYNTVEDFWLMVEQ